jgi:hypothetical protein
MQSVLFCFSKYKLLKNYFPKSYIGRGPISKHSTPRVSTISQTNNKHTSQRQRQTPKIASGSLHRIALWLLAHINTHLSFLLMNVGLVPQNFKNKNTELLCAPRCRPEFMCQVMARRRQSMCAGPDFDVPYVVEIMCQGYCAGVQ